MTFDSIDCVYKQPYFFIADPESLHNLLEYEN